MIIIRKIATFGLIIILFLLFNNCKSYIRVSPQQSVEAIEPEKSVQLHYGTQEKYLTSIIVDSSGLHGVLDDQIVKYKKSSNKYIYYTPRDDQVIHIYLNKPIPKFKQNDVQVSIPYTTIETYEIYQVDKGKSAVYGLGTVGAYGLGGIAVTYGVAIVLILLFKSSCPFIYVDDGNTYNFTGEIFSGAVFPPIERHDYLPLPDYEFDDSLNMIVTNEVREIQHINLLEMMIIEHPPVEEVLVDKYGDIHAMKEIITPGSALNTAGDDVLDMISKMEDFKIYDYDDKPADSLLTEQITLTFNRPENCHTASLVIRAKNDPWLDYSYMHFHDQLGRYYNRWVKKQQKADAGEMQQWSLDQKIPLQVYLKEGEQLLYQDHFNVCGPMAFKKDVLPLDLSKTEGDEFTVVLESGFNFWEIDFIGIAYEYEHDLNITLVPPDLAITQDNEDVRENTRYDDDQYYVQEEIGDIAELSFLLPERDTSLDRSYVLHSKGYYDILMDPPDFRPPLSELKQLKKPLSFTKYSKQKYLEVYQHQMVMMQSKKPADDR